MKRNENKEKMLLGNTFPMALIRHHTVTVVDCAVEELAQEAQRRRVVSYWGHENTRAVAEAQLGVDLRPKSARPAITLDAKGYPSLDGNSFTCCYVLSPDYRAGYRPAIGEEVCAEDIQGWHALKLTWTD